MRVVKGLVSLLVALVVAGVLGLTLAVYLALAHGNLPILRSLVTQLGRVLESQTIEGLELEILLHPDASELTGVATVSVRPKAAGRRHVYFLLNDGLKVEQVSLEGAGGILAEIDHYRLGPLGVATLPTPVTGQELLRLRIAYGGNPTLHALAGSPGTLRPGDVILKPEHFWYPTDLQGFFTVDCRVTLPNDLTLLHAGREMDRQRLGDTTRVRWTTARPVAGLALVAGTYALTTAETAASKVALEVGVDLEPQRILDAMQVSERLLTERYGPTGFEGNVLFVNRSLERAFNDGAGLIGVAPRYFSRGDYGFATIAHEVAHNWWGGTIAEKWLRPGTGGEWIVEGFAEFSSMIVVRDHLGEAAHLRHLEELAYDPTRTRVLAELSVLDNALDPGARPAIYHKGALATRMLQFLVGEEPFFMATKRLFERFGYRQASDSDLEATFADETGQDVGEFFSTWLRSGAGFDLALDPQDGGAVARNHGAAWTPAKLPLWKVEGNALQEADPVELGVTLPLGTADRLLLDPTALTPDMFRENNFFPARSNPRFVAASARGELLVVSGEPYSWSPATVAHVDSTGATLHSWSFEHGVQPEPQWAVDGLRILAVESDTDGTKKTIALGVVDGNRQTIAREAGVGATAEAIVATRGDRLLRLEGKQGTTLVRRAGWRLSDAVVSPDQRHIAYVARQQRRMELRVVAADGNGDRLLFGWPRSDVLLQWAPSGEDLLAALPGDWDWQLWELPIDGEQPKVLVREAAAIGAIAPLGNRVAFTAVSDIDPARGRHEIFVLDRDTAEVKRFDLQGQNAESLAWRNPDEIVTVVSDPAARALPRTRELRRLSLSDGSLTPFP